MNKGMVSMQKTAANIDSLLAAYIQMEERMRRRIFCRCNAFSTEPQGTEISTKITQQLYKAALAVFCPHRFSAL